MGYRRLVVTFLIGPLLVERTGVPFSSTLEFIKREDQVGLEIVFPGGNIQCGLVKTIDPATQHREIFVELVSGTDKDPVLFIIRPFVGNEELIEKAGIPGFIFNDIVVDRNNGIDPIPEPVAVTGIGSETLFNPVPVFQFDPADIIGENQLLPDPEFIVDIGFLKIAGRLHGPVIPHRK